MIKVNEHRADIDINKLLEQRRQVALVLGVEDVLSMRPDLSDAQAWNVLEFVRDNHDTGNGVACEWLEGAARKLFGTASEMLADEGENDA